MIKKNKECNASLNGLDAATIVADSALNTAGLLTKGGTNLEVYTAGPALEILLLAKDIYDAN